MATAVRHAKDEESQPCFPSGDKLRGRVSQQTRALEYLGDDQYARIPGIFQPTNLLVNRNCYLSRCCRAAMLFNVIADLREVADRRIGPANSHQPGYRWLMIFLTSS